MNSPFLINFKDCILLMNLPFVIYILHELYVQKKKRAFPLFLFHNYLWRNGWLKAFSVEVCFSLAKQVGSVC